MCRKLLALGGLGAFIASVCAFAFDPEVLREKVWCENCGAPNDDWRRYRNVAFNHSIWDFSSTAHERMNDRAITGSERPIQFKVCSEIDSIKDAWGCQWVQVSLEIEPGLGVDLPWLTGEDLHLELDVESIDVHLVTPDGDPHDSGYMWDQGPLHTTPPQLEYPPGHPFEDDDGDGGGGGGGTPPWPPGPCNVSQPQMTMIGLDGAPLTLDLGPAEPLTEVGEAEDGRPIVLDRVFTWDGYLVVTHQGAHPANHRYAPAPNIELGSRPVGVAAETSRQGWAILAVGETGATRRLQVIAADGRPVTAALEQGIRDAVRTVFRDARRHDHTVYAAYQVREGVLTLPGTGFATLPMCCGGGGGGCGGNCGLP